MKCLLCIMYSEFKTQRINFRELGLNQIEVKCFTTSGWSDLRRYVYCFQLLVHFQSAKLTFFDESQLEKMIKSKFGILIHYYLGFS